MGNGVLEELEEEIKEELESEYPERTIRAKKRIGDTEIMTIVDFHRKPGPKKETLFGLPPDRWKVDITISTLPHYSHISSHPESFLRKEVAEEYFEEIFKELQKRYDYVKEVR